MNLLTKQKEAHRLRKQTDGCRVRGVGSGEGIVREFGKVTYTRPYLKWITCEDLLYHTGNSAQSCVPDWIGGGLRKNESGSEVAQSFPTLCDPTDCSPPGFSIHGILQARILEWVAIPFSRGSSRPRDRTQVSPTAGGLLTV